MSALLFVKAILIIALNAQKYLLFFKSGLLSLYESYEEYLWFVEQMRKELRG